MKYILSIEGMSCKHCEAKVSDGLKAAPGVDSVKVDLKKKSAAVKTTREFTQAEFAQVIDDLGYELTDMKTL